MLDIDSIIVEPRKRSVGDITELAESITALGLLNPVTVIVKESATKILSDDKATILVAGARRLAACKSLGWTEIEANIVELYDLDIELAEIDENLIRMELTALDRAEQRERRKWIYEQKYPGSEQEGRPQKNAEKVSTFADDAAEKTNQTSRTVRADVAIARGIPEKLREEIRGTDMEDSREDLRALARVKDDPVAQKKAVKAVQTGEAKNLRDALKTDKPPTRSATDDALDILASTLLCHPDQDRLLNDLAFFKSKPLEVGKLIWRLKR